MPDDQLSEKNFIQDNRKNPFPFLIWGAVLSIFVCLMWGGWFAYGKSLSKQFANNPFLQVTNREMSIFLWQFPELMRVHAKNRAGYLPAFQLIERVGMDPAMAEEYVVAPPEVLFLYHTWKRQLGEVYISRPIPLSEFREFIVFLDEWQPKYWPSAPEDYIKLITYLSSEKRQDLAQLPLTTLPLNVRMAFQGWKNYMKEGDAINALYPTYGQGKEFVTTYPQYARNFWRNLLLDTSPDYLSKLNSPDVKDDGKMPKAEMAPFFRAAIYNFLQLP